MDDQLKKDLEVLGIDANNDNVTVKLVTAKFKRQAKQKHPDKKGGTTVDFQDLQNAYRRIIKHLEREHEDLDDFEKEFFMKNNVFKECTTSCVVYIQNREHSYWKTILEKYMTVHSI